MRLRGARPLSPPPCPIAPHLSCRSQCEHAQTCLLASAVASLRVAPALGVPLQRRVQRQHPRYRGNATAGTCCPGGAAGGAALHQRPSDRSPSSPGRTAGSSCRTSQAPSNEVCATPVLDAWRRRAARRHCARCTRLAQTTTVRALWGGNGRLDDRGHCALRGEAGGSQRPGLPPAQAPPGPGRRDLTAVAATVSGLASHTSNHARAEG
jgi:hypothetical protein